ncbi:MAG: AsmA family protein, partial [Polycyclovorans sp.]
MPKALKIGLAALGALLVLLIGIAIALPLLIDPNDYRDTIATKVEEATGRSFALGEIELKVFPWVKLRVNDAELGNAAGFGDQPFASVQEADVGVKVLPLLFDRQLVVSAVTLKGLTAHLTRKADGTNNWDDLAR